jgi:hypothetical protein
MEEKIQFRCPQCKKLFITQKSRLFERETYFQCTGCFCEFYFQSDWIKEGTVATFRVGEKPANEEEMIQAQMFPCPKCASLNVRDAKECHSCRVVLDRVRNLPLDPSFKATPSLMRLWEEVVNNYDNPQWHDQFVKGCERGGALKLAEYQYRTLLASMGADAVASMRLQQIEALLLLEMERNRPKPFEFLRQMEHWQLLVLFGPPVVGLTCIIIGMIRMESRNLVGFGVALMVMVGGIEYLAKDLIFSKK